MTHQTIRPWITPLIFAFSFGVLILDATTPIGYADFIFYFLPVAFCSLYQDPNHPFRVAFGVTLLSVSGYFLSPSGIDTFTGLINRGYGLITLWVVAYMVSQIIQARNINDRQTRIKNGVAAMAVAIRGEYTVNEICEQILTQFAQNSQLKLAAIYSRSEGNQDFHFCTGRYLPPSFNTEIIKLGEGLPGTAAKEKKIQELKNLPADYFKLTSALGSMLPNYVIAIPLVTNDQVIAIMELAYLDEPCLEVRDLISETQEMLAIALRGAQHRVRLQELLFESQQMAEELQSQQEELRVTNEELEQQSRSLKESYARMENQQAELEQTNQQLEEQTVMLENQKSLLDERNTELIQVQRTLLEKARALEEASNYKTEFLANMSHELRTPLNSSLILAKLLSDNKKGNLTDEQVKYAEIIYSSGYDLLTLINDILDLSKVEAGQLSVEVEKVPVKETCEHIQKIFEPIAMEKNLQFSVIIKNSVPETIFTDRVRLEQILKNFLSNAFKFTPKGSVTLKVHSDEHTINFDILDTGIGIAEHEQDIIFHAFRQADGTSNRKYGGTGLGLSISRELAKLLQGKITVESHPEKGSCFSLTIPIKYSDKELKTNRGPEILIKDSDSPSFDREIKFSFEDDRNTVKPQSRKILIIEDEEAFAKILYDLAHEMNFEALVSPTAAEGLWLAKKHYPQAILLDVRLPDHNGLMVLDQLKLDPKTKHIPVHVITSSDFHRSAMEMGAMGFNHKPVKKEDLLKTFESMNAILSNKMKNILIVEDDEIQRNHIISIISDSNINIEAVSTGKEALEKLSKKTYDCMITDLSLPDISGFDLLEELSRDNSQYSYPPVIIYTARDVTPDEENLLRKFSGSIIIKGAKSPERLLKEVTLFLHRVETELPPERQKMLKDLRSREKSLEGKIILLVDDDVRNIFALTSVLENYGAIVEIARNGLEAVEKVRSKPEIELVLMDIMMPEMDGYEAIRIIRKDKNAKDLPIIALTAKAMKDDQQKCLVIGANDYMSKPIETARLMSLIRVWLPINRSFLS